MSGFIILQDGRALSKNNAIHDAIIEYVARALINNPKGQELASWLLEQRSAVLGPGMSTIDVRTLTPKNQEMFILGCRQGFLLACKQAEELAIETKSAFERGERPNSTSLAYIIEPFALLLLMLEAVEKGEPPMSLNPHMLDILQPTGNKCGPGWV